MAFAGDSSLYRKTILPRLAFSGFAEAMSFSTSAGIGQTAFTKIKHGPQKAANKVPVSIRLSPDVVAGLRATGAGWQVRADEALWSWLETHEASGSF